MGASPQEILCLSGRGRAALSRRVPASCQSSERGGASLPTLTTRVPSTSTRCRFRLSGGERGGVSPAEIRPFQSVPIMRSSRVVGAGAPFLLSLRFSRRRCALRLRRRSPPPPHRRDGAADPLPSLSQPFTGVVYLEGSGITTDFTSLRGKRIGYVLFSSSLGSLTATHPTLSRSTCNSLATTLTSPHALQIRRRVRQGPN